MNAGARPFDLAGAVRSGARPRAARLRGLGDAWRDAERAIASSFHEGPRAARRLVAAFERLAALSGEREAKGRACRLAGSFHAYRNEHAAAARRLRAAVRLLEGPARDHARVGLAAAQIRLGRARAAERELAAVRRAAARRGDALLAASADLHAAIAAHEGGRPADALAPYAAAQRAFERAGQGTYAAIARQNAANALVLLDRFDEAEPLYAEAARAFAAAGAVHEELALRYNRGALLAAMDRLGAAETELADCERAAAAAGDPGLAALARLDRGETLLRAGLAGDAARVLDAAARGLARAAPRGEVVRARFVRARAAIALGDHALARRLASRRLLRADRAFEPDRRELLGLSLAGARRFAAAADELAAAGASFGASRPSARARSLTAAGWCALSAGEIAQARAFAVRAAKDAARLSVPSLVHAAAALRFAVEDSAGRRAHADVALTEALRSLDAARDLRATDAMRAALLRGHEAWFARAVRHLLAAPRGEARALALLEQWRARSLVELLEQAGRAEDRADRLGALRARVAALEARLERAAGPAFLRGRGEAAPLGAARALVVAERRLADEARRTTVLARPRRFSAADVCAALSPTAAAVSFFADERGGVALVARAGGVRAVALPPAGVASLADELHFRFGRYARGEAYVAAHRRRLTDETERLLAALADATVRPLAAELDGVEDLVIVPHGAWHRVPFAALPFGGGRVVDRFRVALAPSLAALGPRPARAVGRPVIASCADLAAPAIGEEAREVAAIRPDALLLEGGHATIDALRAARAPEFLHVAAHGRFRPDLPSQSGVRVADGWLRALDFGTIPLTASLVVLSGCETGVTRSDESGEVEGLVRGVLASGATDLVVSLWRVSDAATAQLLVRFHRELAGGATPAAALAAAQRASAAAGNSPWHWAAFGAWTRALPR